MEYLYSSMLNQPPSPQNQQKTYSTNAKAPPFFTTSTCFLLLIISFDKAFRSASFSIDERFDWLFYFGRRRQAVIRSQRLGVLCNLVSTLKRSLVGATSNGVSSAGRLIAIFWGWFTDNWRRNFFGDVASRRRELGLAANGVHAAF